MRGAKRVGVGLRIGLAVASLIAVGAAVAGCDTTIEGRPIATPGSPTEPSFPTTRPTRTTSPTTPAPPPSTPPPTPPGGDTLPPDDSGYVFIETKSGQTRCQINEAEVGCEAPFTDSPVIEGTHANGVVVTADGTVQWLVGNIGAIPTVPIDYRTYHAVGWTIAADSDGTRFTNDRTGHGMFVSTETVDVF